MNARAIIVGCLIGACSRVAAQATATTTDSSTEHRDSGGWMIGASVGVPGYRRESVPALFTLGVHFTQMQPKRIGGDLSIGTMPRLLGEGFAVMGVRGNFALPLELGPRVLVIPSAGVSLLGAASVGGGTGLMGLNGGVATVLWSGGMGMRAGISWHKFESSREAVWLLEFGLVGATRPRH